MIELKRILVPTDFSKHSHNALNYAAALADKFGAELYLLHVVQNLGVLVPDMVNVTPPVLPPMEELTAAARVGLERLIKDNHLEKLTVHIEAREGTPFYEIIQFAKEKDVDLIVMGTHGRRGFSHLVLGSDAETVVKSATVPVLLVRGKPPAKR